MEEKNRRKFMVTEELAVKADRRFFNFAIDIFMLSFMLFIGLVVYISNLPITEAKEFMNRFLTNGTLQFTVTSCVTLLYYNFFEIFTSRTIGKFCTNTIVVDENGDRANYEAIMIRSLIRIIPLYWLYFVIFPKRGLHDLISKTFVVNKRQLEESKKAFFSGKADTNDID